MAIATPVDNDLPNASKLSTVHPIFDEFDDDDEEECRLCRGPAEEGRPLHTPCKCSGSIGRVHQDCLGSWLGMSRRSSCELCKTQFRFKPKYADGAPVKLPYHEVVSSILLRAANKWLPFIIRACLIIMLWLFIIPLSTAYSYYGWIHRPAAALRRLKSELIVMDAISGAIITAVIIVSFLSLMSFADFLRFYWRRLDHEHAHANVNPAAAAEDYLEGDDDDIIGERRARANMRPEVGELEALPHPRNHRRHQLARERNNVAMDNMRGPGLHQNRFEPRARAVRQQEHFQPNQIPDRDLLFGEAAEFEPPRAPMRNVDLMNMGIPHDLPIERRIERPQRPNAVRAVPRAEPIFPQNDRFEPQFEPLEPVLDQEDNVDIHVALDEVLGFRGPIGAVLRNMFWLLAFNVIYLGVFAFIPHAVGGTVLSLVSRNRSLSYLGRMITRQNWQSITVFRQVVLTLIAEGQKRNSTLQLPDLATITLGYLFLGFIVFFWKSVALTALQYSKATPQTPSNNENRNPNPFLRNQVLDLGPDPSQVRETFSHQFKVALECLAAVVKVGILLFLKMLLLPLLLGSMLDVVTLSLFDKTIANRIEYAGADLFGSILLHWVVGITFMLLVTVSVLQLREVVHPEILAKVIRPQEPQPDFLGNLLQESGATHTKRMILSLGIYVALLAVHVWFPAQMIVLTGLDRILPFFRPRVCHFLLPQLQMPVELLIFHLSMLTFLEKYKNYIGKLQHLILCKMCNVMGIAECVLPHSIDKFKLLGTRPAYIKIEDGELIPASDGGEMPPDNVEQTKKEELSSDNTTSEDKALYKADPFWAELASMTNPTDEYISSNTNKPSNEICECGTTIRGGQRVLNSSGSSIRLAKLIPLNPASDSISVSSSFGPYRLRRRFNRQSPDTYESILIEVWKEVRGEPISRPPEGWDDLGVGGAEVQGRWAWGDEKCSEIEEGVAKRKPFSECGSLVSLAPKLSLMVVLSWFACILVCCAAMNITLALGRTIFAILQIPDRWVHDPLGFAIGSAILVPFISYLSQQVSQGEMSSSKFSRFKAWVSSFRPPDSRKKACVILTGLMLWFMVCPLCLGLTYTSSVVAPQGFIYGNGSVHMPTIVLKSWVSGFFFLHSWATLCYLGAFTKEFWVAIGNAFNPGDAANNNVRVGDNELDNNDNIIAAAAILGNGGWQGKNGKIGNFVRAVTDVISGWEWDKVDHVTILQECTFPVAQQLVTSLGGSYLIFYVMTCLSKLFFFDPSKDYAFIVPVIGALEKGIYLSALFKASTIFVITIQLATAFEVPLRSWFHAAHNIARDDRYLIGQILMDYVPQQKKSTNPAESAKL